MAEITSIKGRIKIHYEKSDKEYITEIVGDKYKTRKIIAELRKEYVVSIEYYTSCSTLIRVKGRRHGKTNKAK